jgi:PAS domain S-box-containing protein
MRLALSSLSGRIFSRWPLFMAVAFCLFSLLLIGYTISIEREIGEQHKDFLTLDAKRRAMALAESVQGLNESAHDYANFDEIRNYLTNRDLGMSPRYGLNYALETIMVRFSERAVQDAKHWGTAPPRIAYFAQGGELLADTDAQAIPLTLPDGVGEADVLSFDPGHNLVHIVIAVRFKNRMEGWVMLAVPLDAMYRHLMSEQIVGGYNELLLSAAGEWLYVRGSLSAQSATVIAALPENSLQALAEIAGLDAAELSFPDNMVLRTSVPGFPLSIVTLIPSHLALSHIPLVVILLIAGFPLLLLLFSFRYDQQRRNAERLQETLRVAEQERLRVEIRNHELAQEIEQREALERALHLSEERWQLAVSGANDGIWDWVPQTDAMFLSARWKSILGYADDDLASHAHEWRSRIHPDDLEQTMGELQRHLRGESGFYMNEHRLRCKDGRYKWGLARGRAQFDAAGVATRVTGSLSSTNQRKMMEEKLQDQNELLNAISDLSPDGVVSFDKRRRVKYANPAFSRLTGLALAQIEGLDEQDFVGLLGQLCSTPAGCPSVPALRALAEIAPSAKRARIELSSKRILEIALSEGEGEVISQILYFREVTFESAVERMKSEFLSTAAHELRTPMTSIYGFTEMILTRDLAKDQRQEILSIILRQSELIVSILNDLLDLSRIEAGLAKDFVFKPAHVQALIGHVLSGFKLPARRASPVLEMPDTPVYIMADEQKVEQALLNVLSNAYKYSPEEGQVSIRIESPVAGAAGAARPGDSPLMLAIHILDQGIGMTAQQLECIYQRFYRADSSGSIPGTGLGMCITKEIVERHHGGITIESQMGQGTSVALRFPLATADS